MDCEVDSARRKRVLDLLDEDALAVESGGGDKTRLLHPVAGSTDYLYLNRLAVCAQNIRDVIGLPKRKL
jgi:hypothetical protein